MPDKITTEFDPITRFDNTYDQALIDFLLEKNARFGYSNYWVAYRIAFLSEEDILYIPRIPYKSDLRFNRGDNRYPMYEQVVSDSEKIAYITTLHPILDQQLQEQFAHLNVFYQEHTIGPYHIYYDLSRPVRPEELMIEEQFVP